MVKLHLWQCILLLCSFDSIRCSLKEKELIQNLLRDYEPYARPVADASMPLELEIKVTLKQIVDLDERNQILKTNVWIEYYWTDTKLMWNPVSSFLLRNVEFN